MASYTAVLGLLAVLVVSATAQYDPEPFVPGPALANPYDEAPPQEPLHLRDGIGEDLLMQGTPGKVDVNTRYLIDTNPDSTLSPKRTQKQINNEYTKSGDYRTNYDGFPQEKGPHGYFVDHHSEKEAFRPHFLSDDPWDPPLRTQHEVRERDTPAGLAFKREDFSLPPPANDGKKLDIHGAWVKAPLENPKKPQPPQPPPEPPVDKNNDVYAQNENDPVDWDKKTLKLKQQIRDYRAAHTSSLSSATRHTPRSIYHDPMPLPESERVKFPDYITHAVSQGSDPLKLVEPWNPRGDQYKPIAGGVDGKRDPWSSADGTSRAVRKPGVALKEDFLPDLPHDNSYNTLPADMAARGSTGVAVQAKMDVYEENRVDANSKGPALVYGGPEAKAREAKWRAPPTTDGFPLKP
eukprot:TRINITY_DN637_c0_g1_i3.p1 TRINITY_DN637_c0_g1~~TRINITY_DN637_c0_g1_i3.p1  ORF type:complete len:407 (-),score=105.04 TRINITY_DN637_c0_g1_i3:185-1405(-)